MLSITQILLIVLTFLPLFFMMILLALRNKESKANDILIIFMGIIFLQYFFSASENLNYPEIAILGYYLIIPLMLCNPPILYLYSKHLTQEKFSFNWYLLLHFSPALIVLVLNIVTFGSLSYEERFAIVSHQFIGSVDNMLLIFMQTYKISQIVYNMQVAIYSLLMIFVLFRHAKNIASFFSYKQNISLNWLKVFVFLFVCITLIDILLYNTIRTEWYHLLMISYISFLGFFAIKQKDVYLEDNENRIIENKIFLNDIENESDISNMKTTENIKASKFPLSDERIQEIIEKIYTVLSEKKLYKNPKLSLDDLALEIGINKNYLSYILNNHVNKKFYNLINEYRVEEAKKMLRDKKYDNISIEGIANNCGFNSKSVFNPIFKQITGQTPSQHKKQIEK
jgi:AraC-like DNA-binding protein